MSLKATGYKTNIKVATNTMGKHVWMLASGVGIKTAMILERNNVQLKHNLPVCKMGLVEWMFSKTNDCNTNNTSLICYCYGVVSYKASHALEPLSDLSCIPIWVLIFSDSFTSALWLQHTYNSKAGSWHEMSLNLADAVSLPHYIRFFTMQ
jgi:hypothetical protein